MLEQWQSMAGMAGMFLTTIFIGMSIQPLYNIDELRAFGSEGATKSSYIFLELALIGVFTIVIIWLARRGLEAFIKGFIMLSLFFSLFYVVFPYISIIPCLLGACSTNVILPFALLVSAGLMIVLCRFPGMLVISAMSFLPNWGTEIHTLFGTIYLAPLIVALGTLIGGLVGYFALMTQVALGKPQAGLPLLNGGSILGYLISGIYAVGLPELWQNITLF